MKTIVISDFLTQAQISESLRLFEEMEKEKSIHKYAQKLADEVMTPALPVINQKLGQENDPLYLAYCVEYAILTYLRQQGESGGK